MSDTKYNGWTNYATWRVNLEIFDSIPLDDFDFDGRTPEVHELADACKWRAEYYIECSSEEGLARDYALAFLSEVNWHEIAQHLINDYAEQD